MSAAYWISYDDGDVPRSRFRRDPLFWTMIALGGADVLAGVIALAVYLV